MGAPYFNPNTGPITWGRDWNYFLKVSVQYASFNTIADVIIPFTTTGFMLANLGSGATSVVEYSFNGNTVHGELNPNSNSPTVSLLFQDRVASKIWFRIQAGSSGTVVVSTQAWSRR